MAFVKGEAGLLDCMRFEASLVRLSFDRIPCFVAVTTPAPCVRPEDSPQLTDALVACKYIFEQHDEGIPRPTAPIPVFVLDELLEPLQQLEYTEVRPTLLI